MLQSAIQAGARRSSRRRVPQFQGLPGSRALFRDGCVATSAANGLEEIFTMRTAAADPAAQCRLAQEIKRLTLPGQMGESFRVV